jgi:Fe2+ or Zn2+ uptake regulation protein
MQVKKEVPTISLATVYKALEALVSAGLALKLTFGDHSARYDSRTDRHSHTHCLRCGAIRDLPITIPAPAENGFALEDFVVTEYRLEVLGYCMRCHKE